MNTDALSFNQSFKTNTEQPKQNTEQPKQTAKTNYEQPKQSFVQSKQEAKESKKEDNNISWKYGTIFNCGSLNFRKQPNLNADILHSFQENSKVLFTEFDDNSEWVKVKDDKGVIGYCLFEYIHSED